MCVCVCACVCVLYPVHVCVLSPFSLSLLIITGLRARISLSAGQPCHISSKQAPSLQKAFDNSPKPWPLKQKPVLHSSFHFPFCLAFTRFIFISLFSLYLFPLFSSSGSLPLLFFPPLFVLPVESVFSIGLAVKVSVVGRKGAPDKENLYVVFVLFL